MKTIFTMEQLHALIDGMCAFFVEVDRFWGAADERFIVRVSINECSIDVALTTMDMALPVGDISSKFIASILRLERLFSASCNGKFR